MCLLQKDIKGKPNQIQNQENYLKKKLFTHWIFIFSCSKKILYAMAANLPTPNLQRLVQKFNINNMHQCCRKSKEQWSY